MSNVTKTNEISANTQRVIDPMPRWPVVLGVDPGFGSTGIALVRLLPDGAEEVVLLDVLRTAKSVAKARTFASDDNVRRCREIARRFTDSSQARSDRKRGGVMATVLLYLARILSDSKTTTRALVLEWVGEAAMGCEEIATSWTAKQRVSNRCDDERREPQDDEAAACQLVERVQSAEHHHDDRDKPEPAKEDHPRLPSAPTVVGPRCLPVASSLHRSPMVRIYHAEVA